MTMRRSTLSATAPAHNDSSMIGREFDACTSETSCGEADSDVIIHAAPTVWIKPPKLDPMLASQMERKMGILKGCGLDAVNYSPPKLRITGPQE
jgi:hypothetical protein